MATEIMNPVLACNAPATRDAPVCGKSRTTRRESLVFSIKWTASIIQILGYSATSFGWTPWNIYLFLAGLLGWLTVGVLWNDRAIMLIHAIALASMIAGMASQ